MLAIEKMGQGSFRYYADLAQHSQEFDPRRQGEPSGYWYGQGAEQLQLTGALTNKLVFQRLFHGNHPTTGEALVRNANSSHRVPGWDLTFSPPNSISLAWALADEPLKQKLELAHKQACEKALDYLEHHAQSKLTVLAFQHGSNRNQDPCLHTHCLVMNLAQQERKQTKALQSRSLYQYKMAAGALYRSELSNKLQQLGVQLETHRSWFEIKGVSREKGRYQSLMNAWSSRRREIEAEKPKTAREAQFIAHKTRTEKGKLPSRNQLFERWQKEAQDLNITPSHIQKLFKAPQLNLAPTPTSPQNSKNQTSSPHSLTPSSSKHHSSSLSQRWHEWRTLRQALTQQSPFQSHFTERDLLSRLAKAAQARPLGADDIQRLTEKTIQSRHILSLGADAKGDLRYVQKRHYQLEKDVLRRANALAQKQHRPISMRSIAGQKQALPTHLNTEQAQTVTALLLERSRLSSLIGLTGSGKTQTLLATKQAYQKLGYHVLSISGSQKGVQEHRDKSNSSRSWLPLKRPASKDSSMTLHRLLWQDQQAHRRALERAINPSKPKYAKPMHSKTVVLVDDAQKISAPQMRDLLKSVNRAGAKLILSGDPNFGKGTVHQGAFHAIEQQHDSAVYQLQQGISGSQQASVQAIADNQLSSHLQKLEQQGMLHWEQTQTEAEHALIHSWHSFGGLHKPQEHLILSQPRDQAHLNQLAQAQRLSHGLLNQKTVDIKGTRFHQGDRVRISETSKTYGVLKDDLGTLSRLEPVSKLGIITLDNGARRVVNFRHFKGLELGYAVNVVRSETLDVNHTYALVTGKGSIQGMNELGRGQKHALLFSYADAFKNNRLLTQQLARQMSYKQQAQFASQIEQEQSLNL